MRLDIKENIVFPFSDPSWITKTIIALVCLIFFPLTPIVMGYQLAIIRQTANGEDDRLPTFEGYGGLWVRGFQLFMVLFLLSLVPMGITVGIAMSGAMAFSAGEDGGLAMTLVMILAGIFVLGCYLALGLLFPAMMLRFAMTEEFSSFFDFSTLMADVRQGLADYLVIVFFPMACMVVLVLLSMFTLGFGALLAYPAYALIMFIQARMIGNYYRLYFM